MSARPNPRRFTPARVVAHQQRVQSGAAGTHRGCRVPRRTERAADIARSARGE